MLSRCHLQASGNLNIFHSFKLPAISWHEVKLIKSYFFWSPTTFCAPKGNPVTGFYRIGFSTVRRRNGGRPPPKRSKEPLVPTSIFKELRGVRSDLFSPNSISVKKFIIMCSALRKLMLAKREDQRADSPHSQFYGDNILMAGTMYEVGESNSAKALETANFTSSKNSHVGLFPRSQAKAATSSKAENFYATCLSGEESLPSSSSPPTLLSSSLDTDLLRQYCTRATELAGQLNPKQCSLILNLFATCSFIPSDALLQAYSISLIKHMSMAVPQDLSLILHAYVTLGVSEHYPQLMAKLCEEIPHKLPHFIPVHISSVAHAVSKAKCIKNTSQGGIDIYRALEPELSAEIKRRIIEFDATSLRVIICAFSRSGYHDDPSLWSSLFNSAKNLYLELTLWDKVLICSAISSMNCSKSRQSAIGFESFAMLPRSTQVEGVQLVSFFNSKIVKQDLAELSVESVCILINSFRKLSLFSAIPPLLVRLCSERVELKSLECINLTQLISSISQLMDVQCSENRFSDKRILECCDVIMQLCLQRLQKLCDNPEKMSSQGIAISVHSLGKLAGHWEVDEALTLKLQRCIIRRSKEFTPQGLAMLVSGFTGMKWQSEVLYHCLASEVLSKISIFDEKSLATILSCYHRLSLLSPELEKALLQAILTRLECPARGQSMKKRINRLFAEASYLNDRKLNHDKAGEKIQLEGVQHNVDLKIHLHGMLA